MSGSAIKLAIKELEDKLERAQKEVSDTKNAINVLLGTLGESPRFAEIAEKEQTHGKTIRPDQYFRKSITNAAKEYLKMKGSAATIDEIIDALKKGGCELGQHPNRNLRIALSKNSYAFAPISGDTFGLWEFYGGRPKKKAEAEPSGESEPEVESDIDVEARFEASVEAEGEERAAEREAQEQAAQDEVINAAIENAIRGS
jgi:hypothetical protein